MEPTNKLKVVTVIEKVNHTQKFKLLVQRVKVFNKKDKIKIKKVTTITKNDLYYKLRKISR